VVVEEFDLATVVEVVVVEVLGLATDVVVVVDALVVTTVVVVVAVVPPELPPALPELLELPELPRELDDVVLDAASVVVVVERASEELPLSLSFFAWAAPGTIISNARTAATTRFINPRLLVWGFRCWSGHGFTLPCGSVHWCDLTNGESHPYAKCPVMI
jgi:hypothetical protein